MAVQTKTQIASELSTNFGDGGAATAAEFRAFMTDIIDSVVLSILEANIQADGFGMTASFTNDNAGAVTIGQPVYIKTNGNMDLADADAASTAVGTIGLVAEASIASAGSGEVCFMGIVDGFDTSGLTVGALVYVATGTAGALTSTQPTGSGAQIKPIGICIESHATTGRVLVCPSLLSAAPLADGAAFTDENGNEWLVAQIVASAVNYIELYNAATGNPAEVRAAGSDTNIDLELAAKGTGVVKGALVPLTFAISDETSDLTTGTGKLTWYAPRAFTIREIHACCSTAPVGATLIIDVNDGGTSIMTTNKLVIDAGENSTSTAATAPTLTDTAIAAGAAITFDIDQIGSSTAGAGAKVTMLVEWT